MAEQFSASAAFTNMNNNTDGWEGWGDWNDTAAAEPVAPSKQPLQNAPTNPYFQPHQQQQQQQQQHPAQQQSMGSMAGDGQQQQYFDGATNHVDQHNHNYLPSFGVSQPNASYQAPQQYSNAGYSQQPSYGQTNNFFGAAPPAQQPVHPAQRTPLHPPPSTTPQLVPTFSQTISDSFDTSGGSSWNFTASDVSKQPAKDPLPDVKQQQQPLQPVQPPVPQGAAYDNFLQPSSVAALPNAQLQRLKAETLSPQWSIESQVSSGDRSLESEPTTDTQVQPGSMAFHSEGDSSAAISRTPAESVAMYAPEPLSGSVPDRLDEVLQTLSIKQETVEGGRVLESFPPPPPSIVGTVAAGGPLVNESLTHPSKSSSTTPPLPPPPVDNPVAGPPGPPSTSGPPTVGGPPPKSLQMASSNPFKRTGPRSHTATPGLAAVGTSVPNPNILPPMNAGGSYFYQQQNTQQPTLLQTTPVDETNNLESSTPENQEILTEMRPTAGENHEIGPSNDRNQYLQTGHLSEDGYGVETTTPVSSSAGIEVNMGVGDANDGRLPPPGLSRYVPGQNEQRPEPVVPVAHVYPEPPPGLDRMVPGMDLQNPSDLSLERQADGEVSDSTSAPVLSSVRNDHLHHQHNHHGHGLHHQRVDMSDRNLYRVPGEDDNHGHHSNQQRVVPGGDLDSDRPAPATSSVGGSVQGNASLPGTSVAPTGTLGAVMVHDIPEEQRELVMDGENPDDQREHSRPVGGNADAASSGPVSGAPNVSERGIVAIETETNVSADVVAPRKEPSNASTADESDKGGFYGNKGSRREDDSLRRSNKSKSSRDRYDTEDSDYSEHERRRRERDTNAGATASTSATVGGAGGVQGADTGSYRQERVRHSRNASGTVGERDKDKRKDTGRDRDRERDRERDRDRDRDRDYDYRERDRNRYDRERERYGRGSKYERESRYETDGSKYETERSTRYDKEDKRYGGSTRDDYYRKREERERGVDDTRAAGSGRDRERDPADRRQRKEKERSDRYRGGDDRRKDDRYREGEKRRDRHERRYDPEDYRGGSRNGTERDRARDSRERDDRKEKERKYMGATGGYGVAGATGGAYGPGSGYYDAYNYYAQHQQYYEQLRRTNPQAYAEWYRTYYAQMQASQLQRDLLTTDGRESVHSGRSSANDKERFNRTTPFTHPPGLYNPEDYARHFNNQSLPSAAAGIGTAGGPASLLDQSYMTDMSGQPSSLPPMFQQHHHSLLLQQQHHQQQQQRANTSLAMNRTYHSEAGGYFQPRIDQIDASSVKPNAVAELSMMEPERLTPRKFPEIHPIVNLSAGLLISTKNRLTMNGMADTVKIFSLGFGDASRKLFQTFPGPLVKGVTHKKSVIEFCEEQLRVGPPYSGALALIKSRGNSINSLHSSSLAAGVNRSSFALLWNYIILLLRQNGTFVGTDISELLMRNKDEYPFEPNHSGVTRSANISGRNSSLSQAAADRTNREVDARQDEGDSEHGADANGDGSLDGKELIVDASPKATLSEMEITDKFRNYLLYGNIGEALEWATEHNLWGHALFLASKVDSRQHANVMMKFANKLTLNDPLQTLYQLLSGRTPASVTSVLDEKWGDWRPHLAMLMSNSSAKPELIKKSITTLGDTLLNRGDLYAAHFCYLLSDVAFSRFADAIGNTNNGTTVRLVLLGAAHHHRSFRELSTNESIMMTEVYEYARSLNEERYSITELQRYKYLLACRMLDQGMQLKCLLYMEQIAEQINYDPYRFDVEFVRKVFTLGDRLKYYDPVMEKALDESVNNTGRGNIYANVDDPEWLKRLHGILLSSDNMSVPVTNYNNAPDAPVGYEYGAYSGYAADQSHAPAGGGDEQQADPVAQETNDINQQFNEINQQLGQLNLQYSDQQQQQQQPQQYQPTQQNAATYEPNTIPSYDQGYESINQQSLMDPTVEQPAGQQQESNSYDQQQQQQQQQQFNSYNSYDQQQHSQQHPLGAPGIFTPAPLASNDPAGGGTSMPAYDGGYWGASGNNEAPKPTISMPNSVSQRPGYGDDVDDARTSTVAGQPSSAGGKPQQPPAGSQGKKAPPGAKDSKAVIGPGGAQGSGWFGGIWNKFSLKPKNQMILPDDKNPKIVWDEVSKRWVNTDEGGEAETEAYKPPPKMADLVPTVAAVAPRGPMVPQSNPHSHESNVPSPTFNQQPPSAGGMMQPPVPVAATATPASTVEPTKVPTLQSNMYKMQRNRTLKRSYVDVFNPSGAAPSRPTDSVLAPAVPTLPSAQGGFFVPGGGAPNTDGVMAGGQQANDVSEGMPQFYNPNQFAGGYQ